jgi:hypothetical protein
MVEMGCEIEAQLTPETARFYQHTLEILQHAGVPHMLAGAHALAQYTGIARHTKDLDVFVRPADRDRALKALADAGYEIEIRFPFWIAKAKYGDAFVDLIYRSPNGIGVVTEEWLARANTCRLLGLQVAVAAPEEILFCKIFILNNDRNDLADVMHLFHSYAERLDWERVLQLCDPYYRVLLSHMILFGFVYPSEKQRLPPQVLKRLTKRLLAEEDSNEKTCNGSLLSHSQYKVDIQRRGFRDGRLDFMTPHDIVNATISADDQVKPEFAEIISAVTRD